MTHFLVSILDWGVGAFLWIEAHSTLILSVITGVYAYIAYKMYTLSAKQILAEIVLDDPILRSPLSKDNFSQEVAGWTSEGTFVLTFHLEFVARNASPAHGTIDKPVLVLALTGVGREYRFQPKTKDERWEGGLRTMEFSIKQVFTDLGKTVYLRPGEAQGVELEYAWVLMKPASINELKAAHEKVSYFMEYKDNLGKSRRTELTSVGPTR